MWAYEIKTNKIWIIPNFWPLLYITLTVFSFFPFAGVHEPQSGPPAQRLRHRSRWQLGYLRDCFITAREVPDVHRAHLRPASSSCGGQRARALLPRHNTRRSGDARVHALTLNAHRSQWLREDRGLNTSVLISRDYTLLYVMIINTCLNV